MNAFEASRAIQEPANAAAAGPLAKGHRRRADQRCRQRSRRFSFGGAGRRQSGLRSLHEHRGADRRQPAGQRAADADRDDQRVGARRGPGHRELPSGQRDQALFLLVLLTGVFLVIFGLLRLGRLVRFVSHAVMIGFLIGVAVVLILDQLAPMVGLNPRGRIN